MKIRVAEATKLSRSGERRRHGDNKVNLKGGVEPAVAGNSRGRAGEVGDAKAVGAGDIQEVLSSAPAEGRKKMAEDKGPKGIVPKQVLTWFEIASCSYFHPSPKRSRASAVKQLNWRRRDSPPPPLLARLLVVPPFLCCSCRGDCVCCRLRMASKSSSTPVMNSWSKARLGARAVPPEKSYPTDYLGHSSMRAGDLEALKKWAGVSRGAAILPIYEVYPFKEKMESDTLIVFRAWYDAGFRDPKHSLL